MIDTSILKRDLADLSDEADAKFGKLAAEQLNWRPGAEQWSVA